MFFGCKSDLGSTSRLSDMGDKRKMEITGLVLCYASGKVNLVVLDQVFYSSFRDFFLGFWYNLKSSVVLPLYLCIKM